MSSYESVKVQRGKHGQQEIKRSRPKLDWDQKRLQTVEVNPFIEWVFYPPQRVVSETMRKRGRPKAPRNFTSAFSEQSPRA